MRVLFFILLNALSAVALANSVQPLNAKAPKGTIPYSKSLCKTKSGKEAFSFVKIKPKLDKSGCTTPVKSWVYDENSDKWSVVKANLVKCCDPSAGAGVEP